MKMKCPKCHSDLNLIENRGVEVDFCNECKGVWFDMMEIDQLSDAIKEFNIVEPRLERLKVIETTEETRKCPRCGFPMDKVQMNGRPPMIDFCPNGCGYWFDDNELKEYTKNNMTAVQKPGIELLGQILNGDE